jgi:hypothetical protein
LVQKRKIVYDKSPNSKQKIVAARIFLIDGTGALVTAALLSLALARHEALFEMKPDILYFLASLAVLFALYSFTNAFLKPKNRRQPLKAVVWANTSYCLLTLGLVIYYYHTLTLLGIAYFMGEIVVILLLVRLETKVIRTYT